MARKKKVLTGGKDLLRSAFLKDKKSQNIDKWIDNSMKQYDAVQQKKVDKKVAAANDKWANEHGLGPKPKAKVVTPAVKNTANQGKPTAPGVGGALENKDKLGASGDTHGLIPHSRSEQRDNSRPILNAMPHGAPDYHPTEPLRLATRAHYGDHTTFTHPLDFTLPHATSGEEIPHRSLPVPQNHLVLQAVGTNGPPAHALATSGDNRHEVLSGGGIQPEGGNLSFNNFKKVGEAHSYTHPFGGDLKHGDNCSGIVEGGGLNTTQFYNPDAHPIRQKQIELSGGGLHWMTPVGSTRSAQRAIDRHYGGSVPLGGKSVWGSIIKNVTGTLYNGSKFVADNPEIMEAFA